MAISPVSSVSFNNYNNISFEGRRNKKHAEYQRHSTSPIKAIPLAALIAMSPMVDTYAYEPYTNYSAYVQDSEVAQQNKKVPLPSNFSYINRFVVDMPNGDKLGLYFIDTDSDKSDYEMFEYIHIDKNSEPIARGIVKGLRFSDDEYGKSVLIHGIRLSTTDSKDYAPHGEMRDHLVFDDAYNFFSRILYENSNNGSIRLIKAGTHYEVGNDIQNYKRVLGIIK